MAQKKWSSKEIKERAHKYHFLKETEPFRFIKKILKIKNKTGFTPGRCESLDRGLDLYNRVFDSHYSFVWQQTGEAQLYELEGITSATQKKIKRMEEEGQLSLF